MTIFSGYTVLMKGAISHGSNPLVLGLLRECLALCVLLPYAYVRERRRGAEGRFWVAKDDIGAFMVLGLLMIWCVQLLSALSLNFITASQYALFSPSVPVFCLLVSWLSNNENFHRRLVSSWLKATAIVVTLGGALFIALMNYSPKASAKNPLLGFAYLLVNKIAVGAYPVHQKALLQKYPSHVVVAWGYAAGAVLTLMSAATGATDAEAWVVAPSGWAAVVYSALLSSALNYLLMAWVNKLASPLFVMGAWRASLFAPARAAASPFLTPTHPRAGFYPLQMVLTPLLATSLLAEPFHSTDAVGGVFIIIGLALLMRAKVVEAREEREAQGALAAAAAGAAAVAPPALAELEAVPAIGSEWDTPLEAAEGKPERVP
jgi:drug/metabolite transporter (DMT)-like permease